MGAPPMNESKVSVDIAEQIGKILRAVNEQNVIIAANSFELSKLTQAIAEFTGKAAPKPPQVASNSISVASGQLTVSVKQREAETPAPEAAAQVLDWNLWLPSKDRKCLFTKDPAQIAYAKAQPQAKFKKPGFSLSKDGQAAFYREA